jgi:hypothetical protein
MLAELGFEMGCNPDGSQGPFLGQDEMRIEHLFSVLSIPPCS